MAYNYESAGNGGYNVYPPGTQAPAQNSQVSTAGPAGQDVLNTVRNLPPPSQLNAKAFGNLYDYQKEALLGLYEAQGWDPGAAQQAFERSLPKYSVPLAGTVRL
jgi:hypothetical protein